MTSLSGRDAKTLPVDSSTPGVRMFLAAAWRLIPAATKYPFVLRPAAWRLALGLWLAVAVGFGVVLVPLWQAYAGLGVLLAVILAGRFGWSELVAPSENAVVLVSQLAASSREAESHAGDHLDALVERLSSDSLLARALDIRVLPVAVSKDQAEVLIDETPAFAVVFGSVRAAAGKARWRAEMLLRSPGAESTGPAAHLEIDPVLKEITVTQFGRRQRAPTRHEMVVDAQQSLTALTAERFEARHVDAIEATLQALVADRYHATGDDESAREALDAASRYRQELSLKTRATLEVTRAHLAAAESLDPAIARLEEAGNADADHPDVWTTGVLLSFLSQRDTKAAIKQRVRFARRAVQASPDDPTARYNLGAALLTAGKSGSALAEYRLAAEHAAYRDRAYVHMDVGVLAYNAGDMITAAAAYRRVVELQPTARGHLYLADALRRLGDEHGARENYLAALRRDRRLVDAHRGYWYVLPPGAEETTPRFLYDRVAVPLLAWSDGLTQVWRRRLVRPLIWRLALHHHRSHPEDSRLYFSLGAYALVRGKPELAEEMLTFAIRLLPADLQARARLAAVLGLQGRESEAAAELRRIKQAPLMPGTPGDPGFPYAVPDGAAARALDLWMPFLDEPKLTRHSRYEGFEALVEHTFGREARRWLAERRRP